MRFGMSVLTFVALFSMLSMSVSAQNLDIAVCDPANGPFTMNIDNPWLPMPVGMVNVLEDSSMKVQVTVLDQTEVVAGVTTRVLEEKEWSNGNLIEISRNFFVQAPDGTVCYYGEDVDIYSNGQITGHAGQWRAGVGENKPGIMMPANPAVGMTWLMENAPGVIIEDAVVNSIGDPFTTPAKSFGSTLYIVEDFGKSHKRYAQGYGMIFDDGITLTSTTMTGSGCPPPPLCGIPPPDGCRYSYTVDANGCQVCGVLICSNPDTDGNGCVSITEIVAYVEMWKSGTISLSEVIAGVEQWQLGCALVFCKPEQRGGGVCTLEYAPVCGNVNVQCITTPCPPVKQTFSNGCIACSNSLVDYYVEGEC